MCEIYYFKIGFFTVQYYFSVVVFVIQFCFWFKKLIINIQDFHLQSINKSSLFVKIRTTKYYDCFRAVSWSLFIFCSVYTVYGMAICIWNNFSTIDSMDNQRHWKKLREHEKKKKKNRKIVFALFRCFFIFT